PHTRLNLNGSLGAKLVIDLTTRDLNDLLAAAGPNSAPAVAFDGGQLHFAGAATGRLAAPRIIGHLDANQFRVDGRRFDSLALDLGASDSGASVSNGSLTRGTMQAQFAAVVGLKNW